MSQPRIWVLEVWELDHDTIEMDWCVWSSTFAEANARKVLERLQGRGHKARIRNSQTGEIVQTQALPQCPHCEEVHALPHDGSCIL